MVRLRSFGRAAVTAALLGVVLAGGWSRLSAQDPGGTITGRVVDAETQRPVANAQVHIPGTGIGTLTDAEGRFTLANVPAGAVAVRVELIGYATIERSVRVAAGQTVTLEVAVGASALSLDEIMVTATGEVRAREIGNSLARITTREIQATPARNTQDLLLARAPGVDVLLNSGQPGAASTIRLRGNNSVSQGNDPLIYVDGVRIFGGNTPTQQAARQNASPLNDINPADIERLEIIKGAAATTLYGTEAASGVIQIFTKRGRSGVPQWTAELTGGINNMGHIGPGVDPTGMWVNRCRGDGLVGFDGRVFEDVTCPASGSWLQNGPVQRYALSVAGGLEQMSYYLSGNYSDEQGIIHDAGGSRNGGFLGNFTFHPFESLSLTLSSQYSRRVTDWVPSGDNGDGFMLNVTRGFGSNFNGAEGCLNPDAVCVGNGALLTADNTTRNNHFITGFTVLHEWSQRLTNRLTIGYDYNNSEIENIRPFGYPRAPLGDMEVSSWRRSLLSLDYAGTFSNRFSESLSSSFSWGGQMFADASRTIAMSAEEFSGPGQPTLTSAARRSVTSDNQQRVTNAGFFLQEALAWRDRLFLTGGVRIDGNSAFGSDFGLQAYPKLSVSYVLSDEEFWPFAWWQTLKLRGALGESGKAPGAFDAVRTWDPIAGDDGQPAFTPNQLGNPQLGPERSRELEVGFETGLLDGRIGVDFTYYQQRTFDALIPVRYPPTQGFLSTQLTNVGEIENSGLEVRLDLDLLRRENLGIRARADYSTVSNEAIDLGGQVITVQTFGRTFVREGFPVPAIFGQKIVNPNEFADPIYESDAYLGSAYPTENLSLSTTVTLFRDVSIDALGEFKWNGHMVNGNAYQNGRRGAWPQCYEIQRKDIASRGADPGALDDVPALWRARCALNDSEVDPSYDAWIEATDFFKLRSVAISYNVPERFVPVARSATLRLAGRNLWTSTDYNGTDPEIDDYRTSLARRDYYVLPTYRSFLATLRVTF